jgi:amino acid transporter
MSTNPRPELLRVLGLWTAVAVTAGSVIGSGIFKKPQPVAQNIQHFEWIVVAWVLGGLLAIMGALALAELGAMMPRAGGSYVYLKEGYSPLWGFLWGWIEFLILRTGSIAALATVFTESLAAILKSSYALGEWDQKFVTCAVIAFLALVNALGVRWGGLVQNLTTWVKVGSLGAIALLPFVLGKANATLLGEPGPAPQAGNPLIGFGVAALGVLWAYHGWMNLSTLGEEVKNPQRNIPWALLLGVGIVMVVYLGANLAYAVVLPQAEMADTKKVTVVAVSFAERLFENASAGKVISAAIMVSVFGALNANILIGPRTYFALGRDGLFPKFLGNVHAQFRTPFNAILLQAAWACALVLGSELIRESPTESPFDTLTNFVMYAAIIFETMVIASIFRFRYLRPDAPRPYRCWGYPVVPILYICVMAAVLANTVYTQHRKTLAGVAIVLAGAALYGFISRVQKRTAQVQLESGEQKTENRE